MSKIDSQVLKLAERKFNRGEYEDCQELALIYLKENDRDLDARLLLARSFFEMESFDQARQQLDTISQFSTLTGQVCDGLEELHEKVCTSQAHRTEGADEECEQASASEADEDPDPVGSIRATRGISPYFGFPEKANTKGHTNNYGFIYSKHRGLIDCPYTPKENEYLVSIFGGSVASGFFQDCAEDLEQKLSDHPDLAGKDVVLLNFATGAVKQPQQLFYLNYFVGIGQKFDLVINLDGINDMAGAIGNFHEGIHPAMPTVTLINAFEGMTSVPNLNPVSLQYFMDLSKAEERLQAMIDGPRKRFSSESRINKLREKIEDMRSRPPEGMVSNPMLEVHRIGPQDYLHAEPKPREEMRTAVLDLWEKCAEMMLLTCDWAEARYVHAIQPNHYYSKKTLGEEDAAIMDEGFSEHFNLMVNDTWPEMISRAKKFDSDYPVYCHMTDVLDGMTEDVYRDAVCHFNTVGHMAMADRLCDFLMEQALG